jgi:hypothetical protein
MPSTAREAPYPVSATFASPYTLRPPFPGPFLNLVYTLTEEDRSWLQRNGRALTVEFRDYGGPDTPPEVPPIAMIVVSDSTGADDTGLMLVFPNEALPAAALSHAVIVSVLNEAEDEYAYQFPVPIDPEDMNARLHSTLDRLYGIPINLDD